MHSSDFDENYFISRLPSQQKRSIMHHLDAKWVAKQISNLDSNFADTERTFLDIGCSDGGFLSEIRKHFPKISMWGIEPNRNQAQISSKRGIIITDSVKDAPDLDSVILRGVLHHLPDYQNTLQEILHKFRSSSSDMPKTLILLSNVNSDSFQYRKFGQLPSLESSSEFNSIYKVHSAKILKSELESIGFKVIIRYPYIGTPYSRPFWHLMKMLISISLKKYLAIPFYRNHFDIFAIYYPQEELSAKFYLKQI